MAVRTKRLWGPTGVTTSEASFYECPAGETAIIKSLCAVNLHSATSTLSIGINGASNSDLIYVVILALAGVATLNGLFWVLQPGESLEAKCSAGTMRLTGFGAELEGVAD